MTTEQSTCDVSKDLFKHLPQSNEELLDQFSNSEHFCVHGLDEELAELFSLPILKSFESLKEVWTREVDVHLPDVRDEVSSLSVDVNEAFEHFKKGQSVLFNDVNNEYGELNIWLEKIRENLKISAHTFSRCLVYGTPEGGGNAPHFDQNINFVIQVHGEKKWWVSKNTESINPLSRHVIGEATDSELQSYSKPMPEEFDYEQASEYTLKPGSVLFVPRGAWHKTTALTDAMSLNFTFTAPTWLELVMTAVRGRLMQSEHWRETARDFKNPEAIDKLNFLLENLAEDAAHWRAEDLLRALGEV